MPLSILTFTLMKHIDKTTFLAEQKNAAGMPGFSTVQSKSCPIDPEVLRSLDDLESYFPEAIVLEKGSGKVTLGIKIFYPKLSANWYMRLSCDKGQISADLVVNNQMMALGMQILKTVVSLLTPN